jgi:hypothetical protein
MRVNTVALPTDFFLDSYFDMAWEARERVTKVIRWCGAVGMTKIA